MNAAKKPSSHLNVWVQLLGALVAGERGFRQEMTLN